MKYFSSVIFLLGTSQISFAQWNSNPAVNTPVCVQTNDQQDVRIVTDSKGGAITTWLDFRNDPAQLVGDIFTQRTDKNGINKWTANGVSICTDAANQTAPSLVEDGNGGAIIAWNDWRSGNRDIYAQKVDSSGVIKWAANGVAVVAKANHQQDAKLISDGAGGAIIVWQDSANGPFDIYAQRISSAGTLMWTAGGVVICNNSTSQVNPRVEIDGAGGAIITWQDKRNGTDYDIYAQHINSSGTVQWAANGVSICSLTNTTQSNPKIEPDGAGGAIIAWQDKRNGNDYDVYAQRVNSSGIVQWTINGVAICAVSGTSQSAVDMTSEGINGAIITWKDLRSGNFDVYAQMVNLSGVVQWTANGVGIATGTAPQYNPNAVGDGVGGAIIVWQDSSAAGWDVKSQRINGSGVVQWAAGGVAVGTAADAQTSPKNVSDGSGGSIYVWQDRRTAADYDVYAHHFYSNGSVNGIFENEIYVESKVFPNPFSEKAVVELSDMKYQEIQIKLYDLFGKEVVADVSRYENGFIIRKNNLVNGVYFYEMINSQNIISTGKIIVID